MLRQGHTINERALLKLKQEWAGDYFLQKNLAVQGNCGIAEVSGRRTQTLKPESSEWTQGFIVQVCWGDVCRPVMMSIDRLPICAKGCI